ncbi:MAG TPA: serine/threonine-protein kinase [Gemmataceae bacterium]|nr:serine/threonine-protein kinase [Gemmataceae bacterium]
MATQLRCPKGHLWRPDEFDDEAAPTDPTAAVACPYCGALCTVAAEPLPATKRAPSTAPDRTDDRPRADFPGYEILNILGSGGMGVVYKARQIRTDRVVALKVPGHLDLETRVRFTTEAQAAARVSHPHIVQVYEVGEHQGRPFLALEYVPGGTLADRLTGTPLPPRPAATLAETVARAVGAAHDHGVVHRDLKPSNILLSGVSDQESGVGTTAALTPDPWLLTPKVADFGLARRLDADTGQTRSGMILGTPDYMAPEQAAGAHRAGPTADVYALGAILYELLTGRPPFRGPGMLETLEQVRTLEPVPPRRLQPAVPRDLETICLKCLQKDPARRYPAAGELADDLRRFLDGLPVLARPVSRLARWVKRARRNPLATGMAAGLCLVLIAAACYGVVYHLRLQAQRDRARYHFQMSVRSVEGLLTEVAEEDLALEPRAELKRKALLEKALAFYEELLRVEPDDPGLAWLAARGARRVADILRLLGRDDEALAAYDQALDRLAALAANPPEGTDPTREIADCHNFKGEVHRLKGDPDAAEAAYKRAREIQQPLHDADPHHAGYRQDLSRTHYNLGIVARQTGRPALALDELAEAARLLDGVPADDITQRRHRARVYLNLGPVLRAADRLAEAEDACGQAIALFDAMVAENPFRFDFQYEREAAVINRGLVRLSARDPAGAKAELTRAADRLAGLSDKFPDTRHNKAELARAHNGLAAVAFDAGERSDVATFDALGSVALRISAAAEAAAMSAKAADEWAALIAKHGRADDHGELGISLCNQGRALYESHPEMAKDLLTQGLIELLNGMKANPREPTFGDTLQKQTRVLAGLLVWARDSGKACALARRMAESLPNRVLAAHRAVALLAACVAAVERQKRPGTEADRYEALAIEVVTRVGSADWSALRADPDCAPLMARAAFAEAVGR